MKPRILPIEDHAQNRGLVTFPPERSGPGAIAAEPGHHGSEPARLVNASSSRPEVRFPGPEDCAIARELTAPPGPGRIPMPAGNSTAMPGDGAPALVAGWEAIP